MAHTSHQRSTFVYLLQLTLSLFLTCCGNLQAQVHFNWALSQGSNASDFINGALADDQGHLYTLLTISDTADLDPGPGTELFIPWDKETAVLSKWSDAGEYIWSAAFQTKGETGGYMLQAKDNKLFIEIYYTDTLTYVLQGQQTLLSTNSGEHVAILTLDLDGQVLSIHDLQPSFNMYLSYFNITSSGDYLIGGAFSDSIVFSTLSGDTTLHANSSDGIIASFHQDWTLNWLQTFSSDDDDYISNLYTANGRIYYSAGHADTITIQTTNGPMIYSAVNGDNAIFGTMSQEGQILTSQSFGGSKDDDEIESITADQEGNMYVCGYFEGEVNFQHPDEQPVYYTSTNSSEGFVSKYNSSGRLQWTRIVRNSEYGGMHSVILHRNENLYIIGGYNGHTDLDPGPDSIIVETPNWGDIYGMKLDKEGNLKWVYNFTGPDLEGITTQIISPEARIYYSGFAYDVLDGDPGPDEFLIPNRGGTDLFLISLTEENVITANAEPDPYRMSLYPNPASDEVFVQGESPIENIIVYSPDGKFEAVQTEIRIDSARLETSGLKPGMYSIQVKTSDAFHTLKFLKIE